MESQNPLHHLPAVLAQDIEFTGKLNQSAGQGAKFSLLLAMLAKDILSRPKFTEDDTSNQTKYDENLTSSYPKAPLNADSTCWLKVNKNTELFNQNLHDAHLWRTMHPEPLSLFNDAKRLDDEVVANCNFQTQLKLSETPDTSTEVEVDETGLYDVLQSLDASPLLTTG